MTEANAYVGLFLSALLAATLIPAQSEAVLAALLLNGSYSVAGLLLIASLGNILGSVVNFALGWFAVGFADREWFPASARAMERARRQYESWGRWSLLLSWVPIIGDPITVVAGLLREPLWSFLLLVSIAKVSRYLVLAKVVLG